MYNKSMAYEKYLVFSLASRYLESRSRTAFHLILFRLEFTSLFTSVREPGMSQVCQVTGKRPLVGNNVSHANNKTKRRFMPNLHRRRFWLESEKRWIRLRVSRKGLRIIDRFGIEQVLADIRTRGGHV